MMNIKPAVFLHIQKTAGTSIVDWVIDSCGSDKVVAHGDYLSGRPDMGIETRGDAGFISPGDWHGVPFVSGHFGYDYARPLMDTRYSFTFLRNPIERVLSFYSFCKSRDPKEFEVYLLTQRVSLDEFLQMGFKDPLVKDCIWNHQAWQLAYGWGNSKQRSVSCFEPDEILDLAIRHLEDFSHIGFTETFEDDRDKILTALGISPPKEKIVSNANPGRLASKDLPRSTLQLLEELTHLDRALYKEAWSRRDCFLKGYIKKNLNLWKSKLTPSG
jgi:hypothetical protein